MMNKNNYQNSLENAFNRCVTFQYIINGPKTISELCEIMRTYPSIIWEHCKWLQDNNFVTWEKVRRQGKGQAATEFTAINIDSFPWSKTYLRSADPLRDYFNNSLYPNLEPKLRDAIYEGRISKDVVKQYSRKDTVRWDLNYKSNFHGKFQSSMSGEYVI